MAAMGVAGHGLPRLPRKLRGSRRTRLACMSCSGWTVGKADGSPAGQATQGPGTRTGRRCGAWNESADRSPPSVPASAAWEDGGCVAGGWRLPHPGARGARKAWLVSEGCWSLTMRRQWRLSPARAKGLGGPGWSSGRRTGCTATAARRIPHPYLPRRLPQPLGRAGSGSYEGPAVPPRRPSPFARPWTVRGHPARSWSTLGRYLDFCCRRPTMGQSLRRSSPS
mmetsp:Transcript_98691/g.263895  ORF Transcript_98691/g.263895 Transcript_98691/m.263895 type:complete len:224 (+) Transcript_98691:446-1117(+)